MKTILIALAFISINSCRQSKAAKNIEKNTQIKEYSESVNEINSQKNKIDEKVKIQNANLKITFEEKINIPNEMIEKMPVAIQTEVRNLKNNPIIYFLNYDGNTSNYSIDDLKKYIKTSSTVSKKSNSFHLAEFSTYKDYQSNLLVIKSSMMDKSYLINRKLINFDWKISNENKKIGNYFCKKATTIYKDEKIIAYYTDEIPFSVGPSIYQGLPGLIIYLEAPDRTYTATKIDNIDKMIVEKLTGDKTISEKDYLELVEKYKNKEIIEEKIEEYHEN